MLSGVVASDAAAGSAVLLVPTDGRGPAASVELERTRGASTTSPTRVDALWDVPVLTLPPAAALDHLLAVPDAVEADVDQVIAGADLRLLKALAAFAMDLVERGRVLPAVRAAGEGRGRATWSAVVTGADAVWLREVAACAPGSLVATCPAETDRAAAVLATLAAATDALVDAAVRAVLGPVRGRRAKATFRAALVGADPYFACTPGDLAGLDEALGDWQREVTHGGAVRACFRLLEPQEDSSAAPWRVDFALQSTEEPSLVVDATQVWRAKGALRALARHVPDPQETLLAELGRAVRLFPDIDGALRTAKPSSLVLDTAGAHAFLSEAAPILLAAGFGVLLPGWWTNPSMRVGAKLSVSTPAQPGSAAKKAAIGRDGLVDFRWDLAVGEHTLTEQEVADLV
ncbi:MAG: SNF2 helicase-associated domain-containing protein, partial [Mycobacteriales bacterium]